MAELRISDNAFAGAEQPEIDTFLNTLAKEQGAKWAPVSDGYAVTGLSETAVADLKDTIMERIENELGI